MEVNKVASQIVNQLGGKDNIANCWHCITRVRFNVKDSSKVDLAGLQNIQGIIGAQLQSGQYQVIIGKEVEDVYQAVTQIVDLSNQEETSSFSKENISVKGIVDSIFDVISGIFSPILPAIVGGGLLKGIMALMSSISILEPTSSTYEIFNFISDAPFHFLPFMIAFSAAKKFKTDSSLAITLAGIIMYPTIMQYAAEGKIKSLAFFGLPVPMNSYSASVLPIMLGVFLMSIIYRQIGKIAPKSFKLIIVPVFTLVITAPIVLMVIAPLGNYIGVYLERVFTTLFEVAGPFAGLLMGGLMPVIVITGMHYAFFPSTFASFDKWGFDIMLLPMNLVANFAQAGAVLGVFLKIKDSKMKQLSISTFLPAIFGITEPAIYGVTMKLKKPFYASLIGGAIGGAIFGTFGVKTFAFSQPGITAFPSYLENGTNNFVYACLGVLTSFLVAAVLTVVLTKNVPVINTEESNRLTSQQSGETKIQNPLTIFSPLSGKVLPLEAVPDQTFAAGLMGQGVCIDPFDGSLCSPFEGTVTMTTPTNHAIGLTSTDGVEVLIHIGVDTVTEKGQGFQRLVKANDHVKTGEELLKFDLVSLRNKGIELKSPIIITNSEKYFDVIRTSEGEVNAAKDCLFMVID